MHDGIRRRHLLSLGAVGAVGCTGFRGTAYAQAYPTRPVKLIVPFAAGGGADSQARLLTGRMAKELGQPFVIENLSGAGGNVGTAQVSRTDPDGYTVLYGTNGTLAINRALYAKPGFDALKDFTPVCRLTEIPLVAVARHDSPFKTLAELLQYAKANPGKASYASSGNGTTSHLAMEMLKAETGARMVHIPYRGGAAAMTDLIGGQVDVMIEVAPNAVPHVLSDRLRALAVTTVRRSPVLPAVPTFSEAGVPRFVVTAWDGLLVRAGTQPAISTALARAARASLADPEVAKRLSEWGTLPSPLSGDEFGAFIRSEIDRWGRAVKLSGASIT